MSTGTGRWGGRLRLRALLAVVSVTLVALVAFGIAAVTALPATGWTRPTPR